jgi:hypothetical protein
LINRSVWPVKPTLAEVIAPSYSMQTVVGIKGKHIRCVSYVIGGYALERERNASIHQLAACV